MSRIVMILLGFLAVSPALAMSSQSMGQDESLALTIINQSSKTLHLQNFAHAQTTFDFSISDRTIKPKQTVVVKAKAYVSPQQINGLGGTLQFTVNRQSEPFVVGDNAIGWSNTPIYGFATNNRTVRSSVTSEQTSADTKHSYDLDNDKVTVLVVDAKQ